MNRTKKSSEPKYLARSAIWDWRDSKGIDVWRRGEKEIYRLNAWETLVFYEADGNNTLDDIIAMYPSMYSLKEKIPKDYKSKILEASKNLIYQLELVKLWDNQNDLPYYFDVPKNKQDKTEALRLMKEDGFIT